MSKNEWNQTTLAVQLRSDLQSGSNTDIGRTAARLLWNYYSSKRISAYDSRKQHQVAVYVDAVHEILMDKDSDSFGFQTIVCENFSDDQKLSKMRNAYLTIGCSFFDDIANKILSFFPESKIPATLGDRYREFCRIPPLVLCELNEIYKSHSHEIENSLAKYIKENIDLFLTPKLFSDSISNKKRTHEHDVINSMLPQVEGLPHWGLVAVASQFSLVASSLLGHYWPNIENNREQSILNAIKKSKESASKGKSNLVSKQCLTRVIETSGVISSVLHGFHKTIREPVPDNKHDLTLALYIVQSALKVAEAAGGATRDDAMPLCVKSISYSIKAVVGQDHLVEDFWRDLNKISEFSRKERWTDKTVVPVLFFK